MRELIARITTMELGKQRDPVASDASEPKGEDEDEEATPMEETPEMQYF